MNMDNISLATLPAITVICYLVSLVIKATRLDNKWIPITCGLLGCLLGIIAMFIVPNYPATDCLSAAAIGILSGLAATGAHQAAKQLKRK